MKGLAGKQMRGIMTGSVLDVIDNSGAKILICADKGHRGSKSTPSKANADVAIQGETTVEKVIVIKRVDGDVPMTEGRDL